MSSTLGAEARVFRSEAGSHLFIVDGSRVYDLPDAAASEIERALPPATTRQSPGHCWTTSSASRRPRYIDDDAAAAPPLFSLSLNVAQSCNMSCGYCYADAASSAARRG